MTVENHQKEQPLRNTVAYFVRMRKTGVSLKKKAYHHTMSDKAMQGIDVEIESKYNADQFLEEIEYDDGHFFYWRGMWTDHNDMHNVEISNRINQWIMDMNLPPVIEWTDREKALFKLKFH